MLLDWTNQYCQNDYTTQGNLQIQCNTYQINKDILHRTRTECFKICMETHKTLNSQSNIEKEKKMEESSFLTLHNTTKLQPSKPNSTCTKTEISTNGKG